MSMTRTELEKAMRHLVYHAEDTIQRPKDGVWCSCCRTYIGTRVDDRHRPDCLAHRIMRTWADLQNTGKSKQKG